MKQGLITAFILIFLGFICFGIIFNRGIKSRELTVKSRGDDSVYVGASQKVSASNLSKEEQEAVEAHQRDLRAIDDAWKNVSLGNSYVREKRFEEAATVFELAYEIGGGIKHVSGFSLAKTYEELGRYEDAIKVLKNMIQNKETNAHGEKKANQIIERLSSL